MKSAVALWKRLLCRDFEGPSPAEQAHQLRLMQRHFHNRLAQIEPVLQEVDAQHAPQLLAFNNTGEMRAESESL